MKENNVLSNDVDLKYLAKHAKNFTGAEIEEIVKNACSWAFDEIPGIKDFSKPIENIDILVEMRHFKEALKESKP